MERMKLVSLLCELNGEETAETDFPIYSQEKYQDVLEKLYCSYEYIQNILPHSHELAFSSKATDEWKCICLSLYIFQLINTSLEISDDEVLSVQQSKSLKNCLKNIVASGILTKLQPNLPFYLKSNQPEPLDIFLNYNVLKSTIFILCEFLKYPNLRLLILPDNLKAILVAVYQICFCPLKKPPNESQAKDNMITQEVYNNLLKERQAFLKLLDHLRQTIHPTIFVKETMVIFHSNSPIWFKRAVSETLTTIIRSKNGVENIALALFDSVTNDNTQTWKILEVFSKLILSCKNFPDFRENICKQVIGILDKVTESYLIYERIFIQCTKSLYNEDQELSRNIFVRHVVSYFLYFTYKDHRFEEGEDITNKFKQHVRLLHSLFVENTVESLNLPLPILKPIINVIFRFYAVTLNTSLKSTNIELKDLLIAFLNLHQNEIFLIFDSFLFGINSEDILSFRNDIAFKTDHENIILHHPEHSVSYSASENSDCMLELLKNKTSFMLNLFGFLLNCLSNGTKYFKKANDDLLNLETEFMNEYFERNLVVYKVLSELAEDATLQKHITENPDYIINYINNVLKKAVESSIHKTSDNETEGFQSLFTILMILQSLVSNCSKLNLENYKILIEPLQVISKETLNEEVKDLVNKILIVVEKGKIKSKRMVIEEVKSDLDKAIEDVCDPLLPVRGHGLMTLAKLIEKKDKEVMERKQYVLNIFQQNLKNEDSFIYLSAIGGLAAMGDVFPDTVLNILCEEYSDSTRKNNDDSHEVRMKIGESLMRVTKILGDMAPKYKPLLLNTFLLGAKDDDHMIRASCLSNLGEICRVLGYKLGTIVNEVLVCVHAIIATDKSQEARRAAVTVIRQLFVGLDNEMIAFLKDDILPIYRTLKEIYQNDKDDVMRLQAQLALEELNENMKSFVFPKPQLNMEKKIIMLD